MKYQKTRIGTLNSNIEFSEMSKNVRMTCEKPFFLENFRILQLLTKAIFNISEKRFDICVQCLNARLLNRHKAAFLKECF